MESGRQWKWQRIRIGSRCKQKPAQSLQIGGRQTSSRISRQQGFKLCPRMSSSLSATLPACPLIPIPPLPPPPPPPRPRISIGKSHASSQKRVWSFASLPKVPSGNGSASGATTGRPAAPAAHTAAPSAPPAIPCCWLSLLTRCVGGSIRAASRCKLTPEELS